MQTVIGITGGIATGKSTVSRYLADVYKLPILDADIYARVAVEKNSAIFREIVKRYGDDILLSDGNLNRSQLGEIIFNNSEEKIWLENQIHPYVRRCFQEKIKTLNQPIIVLVVPLLFEAKMTDLVTQIWVIACSESEQVRRLMQRDRLSEKQAIARINNQLPIAEKIAAANLILYNDETNVHKLYVQIDEMMRELFKLSFTKTE